MTKRPPLLRQERRSAPRRAIDLAAQFQCRGSTDWTQCRVTNISAMGANLELSFPMIATREIRLQIMQDLFEATGEVRHQDGRNVGIEFTSSRMEALARYS